MNRLAVVLLLAMQVGLAQDSNQWSSVQAMRKGDRVGVIQANQKRVEGRFESATESRITLQGDQTVTVEKADVVRVYQPPKHSRLFGTILGGVIGVAGGAVTDATVGQYLRNEANGPSAGVITAIGGAAGAGIGAAVTGGYRTIYRRAK
ncbi:MAG: hypothetical protein ABI806_09650 [Candidatus Solibacter sp.]